MSKRSFLTALLSLPLLGLSGCASTDTVRQAQGQGLSRTYAAAYEAVFNATLAAARSKALDVVESDKARGSLVLSHGVTLWSWGERIAVFVRAKGPASTEVAVVSKPVLSPLNFPPDWQGILHTQIDAELKATR